MSENHALREGKEYHVASFVLHVNPEGEVAVRQLVAESVALEIHATAKGKMVVTAEASHTRDVADLAESIRAVPGVLQLSPVYHEFDSASDPGREINQTEEVSWT